MCLVTVSFCTRIIACPIPLEQLKHFKIDVVHLDTLLKESVNWKN